MEEQRRKLLDLIEQTPSICDKEASFYKLFIKQFTQDELTQLTESVIRQQQLDVQEGFGEAK